MPDDPYTCPQCGGLTWHLRLSPDEGDVSLAPRTTVAVWCTACGAAAPPEHPFWPARAEDPLGEPPSVPRPEDARLLIEEARPFLEDAFAGVLEWIELRPLGRVIRVIAHVASTDVRHLNRCLRVFDETWWLTNCHRSDGLLVFDYETSVPNEKGHPHA